MSIEEQPFRKISNVEYEVQVGGRTKTIKVPFGKVEKVFAAFISNGGIIDINSGAVQTDILSLISSFKEVGNILLTDYSDTGVVTEEGNCSALCSIEVIALFQLATAVIEDFTKGLAAMQKMMSPVPSVEEKAPTAPVAPSL